VGPDPGKAKKTQKEKMMKAEGWKSWSFTLKGWRHLPEFRILLKSLRRFVYKIFHRTVLIFSTVNFFLFLVIEKPESGFDIQIQN
jgi:hypothetical protein